MYKKKYQMKLINLRSIFCTLFAFVCPMHRPRFIPKIYYSVFGTHFCYRLNKPQGLVRTEGLGKLKNSFTSSGLEPAAFRFVA
jgi:hypothetical protein